MEWRIHGVFDRCHGKKVVEFESVEKFEPDNKTFLIEGFAMSSVTMMQCCDAR